MYLKVRQEVREGSENGKKVVWHIIPTLDYQIVYEWINPEQKDYDKADRIIMSCDKKEDHVRRIIVVVSTKKDLNETMITLCNDTVYLCNDNGQTIERI